eukprot:Sspe_Gene.70552::Locus_41662_Transcript_1_1_Confidence_1.000_Length_1868::g.70552::m.70552
MFRPVAVATRAVASGYATHARRLPPNLAVWSPQRPCTTPANDSKLKPPPPPVKPKRPTQKVIVSPLSSTELHCLALLHYESMPLVFGNSVRSLGWVRGMLSSLSSYRGGSNDQLTHLIARGRRKSFEKMLHEAKEAGCHGVIGVASSIGPLSGLIEFTAYGSGVKSETEGERETDAVFSTTCTGEQFYCLKEAGFRPVSVVFGNEAYSRGVVGMLSGTLRSALFSGEIRAFSDVFNLARSRALARLRQDAFDAGCNMVSGVRMHAVRLPFVQEVSFSGTGCFHPALGKPETADDVVTSSLTEEELWSLISLGKQPISVLTGCSVYNMGLGRSATAAFQQIKGGEASRFTELASAAREEVMRQIHEQAERLGADEVVSVRIVMEEIRRGMIEFFAYGTAVKRTNKLSLTSSHLPPQVLMGSQKPFLKYSNLTAFASTENTSTPGHSDVAERQAQLVSKYGSGVKSLFVTVVAVGRLILHGIVKILSYVFPFLTRLASRLAAGRKDA